MSDPQNISIERERAGAQAPALFSSFGSGHVAVLVTGQGQAHGVSAAVGVRENGPAIGRIAGGPLAVGGNIPAPLVDVCLIINIFYLAAPSVIIKVANSV